MAIASAAEVERRPRLAAIDVARGVAIIAMVIYHAGFDLSYQGLIGVDVTSDPFWVSLARATASSFLLLVGISFVLATRRGIAWDAYFRRLAVIAASAGLVSLVTWLIFGPAFVFFGILHQIALASVLVLAFLPLPTAAVAAAAAVVIALPAFFTSPFFDTPALWWVGLSTSVPETVDYVPLFPWFGAVLAGVVVGRWVVLPAASGILGHWRPGSPLLRGLAIAGRWSLAIYLAHQVVLFGLTEAAVGVRNLVVGERPAAQLPGYAAARARFVGECLPSCQQNPAVDAQTCDARCGCVFDELQKTDLAQVPFERMSPDQRTRFSGIVNACVSGPKPAN